MTDRHRAGADRRRVLPPPATGVLVAMVVAGFVLQQVLHHGPRTGTLGVNALAASALGALDPSRVADGEWWRLLTSALLHGDLLHLVFNVVVLAMAGAILERMLGAVWTVALFVVCAVGGGIGSLAVNAPTVISLGASGAIVGMLVAGFLLAGRLPPGMPRSRVRLLLAQLVIPALVPITLVRMGGVIDYAGHVGGAVAGCLFGGALSMAWRRPGPPPGRAVAALVAIGGVLAIFWGARSLATEWPESMASAELYGQLMDDEDAERLETMTDDELADAMRRWPEDPRPHYVRAHRLAGTDDEAAIRAATEALSKRSAFDVAFPDGELEAAVRVTRTLAALDGGHPDVAPEDIDVLCGRLSDTSGGRWAAENGLCTE